MPRRKADGLLSAGSGRHARAQSARLYVHLQRWSGEVGATSAQPLSAQNGGGGCAVRPRHPTQNGGGVADTSCVGAPIRHRGAHSRTGKDRVGLESVNEPMVLGRARVDPGDTVAVDGSCAVVVPRAGGRRAAHRRGDRGQGGFALARPPGRDGPRSGAPAPRLRHAAVGGRVAAVHRPGAGTGDDAASRPSSQPGGAPRPQHGLWCGRSPVRGAAAKTAAAGSHFRPTTTKSGPARAPPAFRGSPFPASSPCGPRRRSRSRRESHQHVQAHQEPEGVLPARVLD